MDKQTKLIILLLCVVIIFGIIFALKVTGIIKPKDNTTDYQNITASEDKTANRLQNSEKKNKSVNRFSYVLEEIILFILIGFVCIGSYKAYAKLGVSKILLIIDYIILPVLLIVSIFVYPRLFLDPNDTSYGAYIGFIFLPVTIFIWLLVSVGIQYCYFKCLDMNGSIAFLALIPMTTVFISMPEIINLVVAVIMIIYGVISAVRLAEYFNKSQLFAIGICFLPFIFIPILGYSKD